MKVILLQDVPKVGKKFEVKNVSDGYGVNFLLPKRLAQLATNQGIKELAVLKEKYEVEQQKRLETSKELIQQLNNETIKIEAKTSSEGKLFAGLGKQEIAEIIKDKIGLEINPDILQLEKPLKTIGEHKIKIEVDGEKSEIVLIVEKKDK